MAYTTIDKPTDYFNTVTWSGDDTSPRNITGVGFQPDLVWGKVRSRIGNHWLIDSNRGTTGSLYRVLNSDSTDAEQTTNSGGTTSYGIVTTIGTDGFTVADGSLGDLNVNNTGDTYVSWNWLAGGTSVTNTDGDITSTVSANPTAGFSIVTWTGDGVGSKVGTGLTNPNTLGFATVKKRSTTSEWQVGGGYSTTPRNFAYHLELNSTAAISGSSPYMMGTQTAVNDGLLRLASEGYVNGVTYVAYVWQSIKGFSKMGTYTGNGNANGTFVYTGFKPAWIMVKRTDSTNDWMMFDNKRDTFNTAQKYIRANVSNAEAGTTDYVDFVSNGVKFRRNGLDVNGSGATYFYMAFAENPFVTSTGIPATAR